MEEGIFRKKSMDKIKSPEELNDYVRVPDPGIWLLLVSAVLLIAGACIWKFFGQV